jgi:P-type conjugative transfer protein TrbJ
MIERIQDQGRTVKGQVEAIQVGNELAASMARQMTQLRSITAAQNEATAVYQARTLAEMDADEAARRSLREAAEEIKPEGGININGRFTSGAYKQN